MSRVYDHITSYKPVSALISKAESVPADSFIYKTTAPLYSRAKQLSSLLVSVAVQVPLLVPLLQRIDYVSDAILTHADNLSTLTLQKTQESVSAVVHTTEESVNVALDKTLGTLDPAFAQINDRLSKLIKQGEVKASGAKTNGEAKIRHEYVRTWQITQSLYNQIRPTIKEKSQELYEAPFSVKAHVQDVYSDKLNEIPPESNSYQKPIIASWETSVALSGETSALFHGLVSELQNSGSQILKETKEFVINKEKQAKSLTDDKINDLKSQEPVKSVA